MTIKSKRGRPPGPYPGGYRKIRLGADPEFELHRHGKPFPANGVLRGVGTPLGVDGSMHTGELRPCLNGGGRVDAVFYRDSKAGDGVSSLLDQLASKLDETFEVFGGSGCHRPLGGHIHSSGIEEDDTLLNLLDQFIAIPLNEVSNTRIRHSAGYAYLGETRLQPWGFEYRSPCSWLSTPDLTRGVLSIAWVLAQAQKHGCLDRFRTAEDFSEYSRKGHAKNIKKFTGVLSELKRTNQTLERIEVLKAWDRRHLLNRRHYKFYVDLEVTDDFVLEIWREVDPLFSFIPLRFVGAGRSRTKMHIVFIPPNWEVTLPIFPTLRYVRWEFPSIGLSWALRQNVPLATQVVRAIVEHTNSLD